jgi:hypothetical protein
VDRTKIDYDLEKYPLEIVTDKALSTNDKIIVLLYNSADAKSVVQVRFGSTPDCFIQYCSKTNSPLLSNLPSATTKVFRITLTRNPGIRIKILCNGVEIVNVLMSDFCEYASWRTFWNKDIVKIQFHRQDKASDKYRRGRPTGY